MSHVTREPFFEVCNQLRLKPACSADVTSQGLEISAIASTGYCTIQAANNKGADQTAQADLRLCCLHMAKTEFSHDVAHIKVHINKT